MEVSDELKEQINDDYQKGSASIQTLARIHRLTVDEVLEILGLREETGTLSLVGDQVDEDELGPGDTPINSGEKLRQKFSTD